MGRGAGNLPTEILISYLAVRGNERYNVIPILDCIHRYFVAMRNELKWGYQLPYMISGIFKTHPYYAAEIVKSHEYSIYDVWRALEIIDQMKPVGYDHSIIEGLIKKGLISGMDDVSDIKPSVSVSSERKDDAGDIPYIKRHAGRDFLILANGPSLKENREKIASFIEKYDPVVMGANYLGKLFQPHYHAFNNINRFSMYVHTVDNDSKLLIGENIPKHLVSEYVGRDYEVLKFKDVLDADFDIVNGRIQTNCRTISVLLVGAAVVMGARRIFIAGMDGYLDKVSLSKSLFYDEALEPSEDDLLVKRHHWNERFLQQIDKYVRERNGEGIHIITPTSHHQYYKGMDNYI